MNNGPSACERLAQSRERLRQALSGEAGPSGGQAPGKGASPAWLSQLKTLPGAGLLIDLFQAWWQKHPLRLAVTLGVEAAGVLLKPTAQRHPLPLVLGAFALGGLLVWVKPWRWVSTPALLAGLLPSLLAQALGQSPKDRT
jgi:hypothetical protein